MRPGKFLGKLEAEVYTYTDNNNKESTAKTSTLTLRLQYNIMFQYEILYGLQFWGSDLHATFVSSTVDLTLELREYSSLALRHF